MPIKITCPRNDCSGAEIVLRSDSKEQKISLSFHKQTFWDENKLYGIYEENNSEGIKLNLIEICQILCVIDNEEKELNVIHAFENKIGKLRFLRGKNGQLGFIFEKNENIYVCPLSNPQIKLIKLWLETMCSRIFEAVIGVDKKLKENKIEKTHSENNNNLIT